MTQAQAIADKLSEIDAERLADLVSGYQQRKPFYPDDDRFGVAPIDCGGTNSSDHSYRFSKLVKLGLADHRKRGLDWGKSPTRVRGSKVYRPTPLGLEIRRLLTNAGDGK